MFLIHAPPSEGCRVATALFPTTNCYRIAGPGITSPVRRCKKSRFLTPHWLLFIRLLKLTGQQEGSVREEATRRGHSGNCQPTRTQCVAPLRRNAMHDSSKPIHANRTSFPSILIHHTFHCQYTFALSRSLVDARTRCVRRLIRTNCFVQIGC